jgi:hypothetical protein
MSFACWITNATHTSHIRSIPYSFVFSTATIVTRMRLVYCLPVLLCFRSDTVLICGLCSPWIRGHGTGCLVPEVLGQQSGSCLQMSSAIDHVSHPRRMQTTNQNCIVNFLSRFIDERANSCTTRSHNSFVNIPHVFVVELVDSRGDELHVECVS